MIGSNVLVTHSDCAIDRWHRSESSHLFFRAHPPISHSSTHHVSSSSSRSTCTSNFHILTTRPKTPNNTINFNPSPPLPYPRVAPENIELLCTASAASSSVFVAFLTRSSIWSAIVPLPGADDALGSSSRRWCWSRSMGVAMGVAVERTMECGRPTVRLRVEVRRSFIVL